LVFSGKGDGFGHILIPVRAIYCGRWRTEVVSDNRFKHPRYMPAP
jgi:hypothetical protein